MVWFGPDQTEQAAKSNSKRADGPQQVTALIHQSENEHKRCNYAEAFARCPDIFFCRFRGIILSRLDVQARITTSRSLPEISGHRGFSK